MATFDDREKAFEKKFEHDQQLQFRTVEADFEEPGPEDVIRKIKGDFEARGVEKSDHQIRRQLEDCEKEAREQVMSEVD